MATNDLLPAALVATGTTPAAITKLTSAPAGPARDQFAKQAGPDVSFKGPDGLTEAYAVFQIDPQSKQLQVMVVDGHYFSQVNIAKVPVADLFALAEKHQLVH